MSGLPERYLKNMKDLLGDEYGAYLDSLSQERRYGLRSNDLRIGTEELAELLPWTVEKIPWIPNGWSYDGTKDRPARHPFYYAGLYYLQEPSAMTPASLLPVRPGERVLDLCAAPGGKSTQLGAALAGKGVLVANDISSSRAKALLKNLELFGVRNAAVLSERPDRLAAAFPGYFDKILIDAPCSGEGMFRKDSSVTSAWEEKGNGWYAALQREIVKQAVPMLRPGGMLLYSTCTFSPEEDEGTVQFILDTFPEMRIREVPRREGFGPGLPDRIPGGDPSLERCVRIWPHRMPGEGHFMALLEKEGSLPEPEPLEVPADRSLAKDTAVSGFFEEYLPGLDRRRFRRHGDSVIEVPDQPLPLAGLRVMRGGWLVGSAARGRFEPSQALAMGLGGEEFSRTAVFEADDGTVIRYLKGETIPAPPGCGKGYVLVCVRAGKRVCPLGFAKGNGAVLKNLYLSGWRWM